MTMHKMITLAALMALAVAVAGCGSIEKLTGMGRDDTVLPGQREDAIPGQNSFPSPNDRVKPGTTLGDDAQQQGGPAQGAPTQDAAAQPLPDVAAPAKPCKATDQKCKLEAQKAAAAAKAQQSQDVFSDPQQ
jgi:hypothetical protein